MATRTTRRWVIPANRAPRRGRLWAFGYADLAALLGYSEGYLRHLVADGELDPRDLDAVCRAWAARAARAPTATPPPR